MSLSRRNPKRDAIERPCIELLEKAGWRVLQISVKDGPDLVAAKAPWFTAVIECKSGKAKKLKPGQKKWQDEWPGLKVVIHSVEQLAEWVKETRG
jgi:Holliday junction resolvase